MILDSNTQKGVAVLLESRLIAMKAIQGGEATDGDVEVSLIADLQEKQDKEAGYLMEDLESKVRNGLLRATED